MTPPTPAQRDLLRLQPHESVMHCSIFKPRVVFAAQIDSFDNTREIEYQNVTVGDHTAIEAGMTLYLGSEPEGRDLGKVRVRSADATQVVVAENSDLPWAIDLYITVVRFFEIWPVYPRYVLDHDELTVTAYKDFDVAYTDQNEVLGSFPNLGPHRAAFRDPATGEATIFWGATGTTNVKGDALTYEWAFEGGTPTGSTAHTPGSVAYDTPGHYVTRLTVSNVSGGEDVSYRHVSIYDPLGQGPALPVQEWGFTDLEGDRGSGGYKLRMFLHESLEEVVDGALIVLFSEDRYGGVPISIGGNHPGAESIFFVGWVRGDSIQYNYQDSIVEFEVLGPAGIMRDTESFSVSVESVSIPATWFEVADMDVERAIYHYLRWHSTVLQVHDVEFVGRDQLIQYFDADRESLYSAINTLMEGTLLGAVVSDRQGKLWCEVGAEVTPNATGSVSTLPVNLDLDFRDWRNEIDIVEQRERLVSWLELGGVQWAGPGNDPVALLGQAPGEAPAPRGRSERQTGLAFGSPAEMARACGDAFAWRNARYPRVDLELAGAYRNFDLAPQEKVLLSVLPHQNQARVSWQQKPFIIERAFWEYDPTAKGLYGGLGLREVTSGITGSVIAIPVDTSDFQDPPPPPDFPPIPSVEGVDPIPLEGVGLQGSKVTGVGIEFDDGQCGFFISEGVWTVMGENTKYLTRYAIPSEDYWFARFEANPDTGWFGWNLPVTGVYMLTVGMTPCQRDGVTTGGFRGNDDLGLGFVLTDDLDAPTFTLLPQDNWQHSSNFVYSPSTSGDVLAQYTRTFVFGANAGWIARPAIYIDSVGVSNEIEFATGRSSITLLFSL